VVKEQLTEEMIDAGAELVEKLDEIQLPISAAFWFFIPDSNEWRLLIASGELPTSGPRSVYERIDTARASMRDPAASQLPNVGLLAPDHPLVQLLRTSLRTGTHISRIRFSKNVINGQFIDDALIYRIV
jgi:hypothetical protein